MQFHLHGTRLDLESGDPLVQERFAATFAWDLAPPSSPGTDNITFRLELCAHVPPPPPGAPVYAERDLIHYYIEPPVVIAHFPRYGQLRIQLTRSTIEGEIIPEAITTYGVFEDLIAIGLSPLLRRRDRFLIHAFAAAHAGRAALLVGGIGSGKTTTGIALVRAGWQLLSNDSPLLDAATTTLLAYPGLLSAYPETLQRFPELHSLVPETTTRRKITFAAHSIYPHVWLASSPPGVILFPQVEKIAAHRATRVSAPEALRLLLPHAVERWDVEQIPRHLAALNRLVALTPAYTLALGPDTDTIPELVRGLLNAETRNLE